jgi:hypothetical protein
MKKFLLQASGLMLVGLLYSAAGMAADSSELYYEIANVKVAPVVETFDQNTKPVMGNCQSGGAASPSDVGGDLDNISVIIDKIINIGKKIWSLVEAGKPVFNVKTDVAHALPAGIQCWYDLESWQAPQSKSWRITYENKLGGKVVEFVYRVSYIAGGQYKGQGHYITQATISPAEIYVAWGYKFNVEGSVPSVFNMGSRENPIAGMQMNIKWSVDTSLNHHEVQEQFFVNGLGEFQKMQSREIKSW